MYCKECGRGITNDSKFCQLCGANQANKSENTSFGSKTKIADADKSRKSSFTILGIIIGVVLFIFIKSLLGGGIIEGAIAGGIASGAAWLISSFKIQATKIGNDSKESEGK